MLTTLGTGDVADRVAQSIQRRGADRTPLATVWTSLAAGGALLALVAMFITWYQAVRTANALNSGWLPPLGLVLVIGGGAILVAKQLNVGAANRRVSADLATYGFLAATGTLMVLNQLFKGHLHDLVFLLVIPIYYLVRRIFDTVRSPVAGAMIEMEQLALGSATIGGSLIVLKRLLDGEHATNGWVWGLVAALAVIAAALMACQYLGILSVFQVVLFTALAISTIILMVLIVQVVGDGWPVLSGRLSEFWNGTLRSRADDDQLGISQGITGSFWIAASVVIIAFPIGIAAAVYLEEYAPRNAFTSTLDIVVRNLAGVPSVVYGLLGLFLFVKSAVIIRFIFAIINRAASGIVSIVHGIDVALSWIGVTSGSTTGRYNYVEINDAQSTLFAGGVTLAILVLPIVIITAAEAVRAVPQPLREGAYGVGATKWEVIRSQVLPFAAPGILTGTLLALARAVGEAAPLILVGAITGRLAPRDSMFSGMDDFMGQFADRFTAMPIVIVGWVQNSGRDEGFSAAAGAAIVVLLVFVVMMNSVAVLLRNYFEKKRA